MPCKDGWGKPSNFLDNCNQTLTSVTSGNLVVPSTPVGYHGPQTCTWSISVASTYTIAMMIASVNVGTILVNPINFYPQWQCFRLRINLCALATTWLFMMAQAQPQHCLEMVGTHYVGRLPQTISWALPMRSLSHSGRMGLCQGQVSVLTLREVLNHLFNPL